MLIQELSFNRVSLAVLAGLDTFTTEYYPDSRWNRYT